MTVPHFVLVEVNSLRESRTLALETLKLHAPYVKVDRRRPLEYRGAIPYGSEEFDKALASARLMQRTSLMNCATVLCGIFGHANPEEFERTYHDNPDAFKETFAQAFQFMGMCAAEMLIKRRHQPALAGEHWTPTDFDVEGFMDGLTEVGVFQDLLEGNYCPDSYFYNPYARSAIIPEDKFFKDLGDYAASRNTKIALVPVSLAD